jgi:Glu-tRNA(Gln) amidotransferase subunit E-like FAD-binding protein
MADNIPLEFENIGEYHRAVLQQLIDNNALLRVMLDYEVEKHAYRMAADSGIEEITEEELEERKREISRSMNDKIREYKLHALAEINLRK